MKILGLDGWTVYVSFGIIEWQNVVKAIANMDVDGTENDP